MLGLVKDPFEGSVTATYSGYHAWSASYWLTGLWSPFRNGANTGFVSFYYLHINMSIYETFSAYPEIRDFLA